MTNSTTNSSKKQILLFIGPLILFITAILWGFSFVAQKIGSNNVGPFTFNAYRFLLAGVLLSIIYIFDKKVFKHKNIKDNDIKNYIEPSTYQPKNKKWIVFMCILVGVSMTFGASMQQLGLTLKANASLTGFITTLYIVIVPIIGLFFKKRVSMQIWICLIIAVIGFGLISFKPNLNINFTALILLLGAIGYALQIVFIDLVGKYVDSLFLSACQFLVGGIICFIFKIIFEGFDINSFIQAIPALLYVAIGSCCIGSTFQIIGQNYTDSTIASLIMSLESIFGLIFSMLFLKEKMTILEYIGSFLVFAASILAQIKFKKVGEKNDK